MQDENKSGFLAAISSAQAELSRLERSSETGIQSVAHAFKGLAGQADTILKQAASIVHCVENENVNTVLAKVQALCLAVKTFLEQRLDAANTILKMLRDEENLLGQLARVRQSQESVATHLKALSVLTNVEVTQLGSVGEDFEVLAGELSLFSKSVFEQTQELASYTENCKRSISQTRCELASSLPRFQREMTQVQEEIGKALEVIDADLKQLAEVPGQFRSCAEQTAQQIAGVVAAIQSHDITRQQIEHVQQALAFIASNVTLISGEPAENETSLAYAGLTIQLSQIKNIRQTVDHWTSQIGRCMAAIQELSTSDLVSIGPLVLNQERELSSQLAHIELLQHRSQEYSQRIQNTLGGLSSLLALVNEHMGRSQTIRHLLQLLTLNSLVEAHRLGRRGTVVSAIANLIKAVSGEWNAIAEQSGAALTELMKLVGETSNVMEVFSDASGQKMREGQAETQMALDRVREAAAFVAKEAERMQAVTGKMQNNLASAGNMGETLDVCFRGLDSALGELESLTARLQSDDADVGSRYDVAEVERMFAGSYTTEIERAVMHAALAGAPLPAFEQSIAGNAVELF